MKIEQEKITVQRTYNEVKSRKSQEVHSDENEMIEVRTFAGVPTATVSMTAGLTKNMGDFNSCRIEVSVSLPTYVEEIDEAASYASGKIDEIMAPALGEFVELLKEKKLLK